MNNLQYLSFHFPLADVPNKQTIIFWASQKVFCWIWYHHTRDRTFVTYYMKIENFYIQWTS